VDTSSHKITFRAIYAISFQPAFFEVGFVEAEVVAEFVEVGEAGFAVEEGGVALGEVPEVVEEEEDLGREVGGGGVFGVGGADEEAEGVGLDVVVEEGVVGGGFEDDGDGGSGLANVGREGLEGALDDAVGAEEELGEAHGG